MLHLGALHFDWVKTLKALGIILVDYRHKRDEYARAQTINFMLE
jgi:hypothetical protein